MIFKKEVIHGCESRGDKDSAYLTRYILFKCKYGRVCLHIFHRSDADVMHDHPWDFLSIILWRGYYEETSDSSQRRSYSYTLNDGTVIGIDMGDIHKKSRKYPFFFLWRKATHRHRVILVDEKPAVSLVFMSSYKRTWGFWTPKGWQDFKQYFLDNGC